MRVRQKGEGMASQRGQALPEALLLFPLLLLLVMATFVLGQRALTFLHLQMVAWAGVNAAVRGGDAAATVANLVETAPTLKAEALTVEAGENGTQSWVRLHYRWDEPAFLQRSPTTREVVVAAERSHSLFGK